MTKTTLNGILLVFFLVLLQATQAHATPILYHSTGGWTSSNATDPQELDGATFDLLFTVDSNAMPISSGSGYAQYSGDLTLVVTGSPGDVDGTYLRSDNTVIINTDFNGYGYVSFQPVYSTASSPVNNVGGFIFLPLPQITFGVLADASLPVGDLTADIVGTWSTGTLGGGSYTTYITHLSGTLVPVPAAVWLFGSGLLGIIGVARRKSRA